ncbi:MAG: FAD-dependent oxidoreductase [Deltaproteobacteria bacterium]|nr:FAD-dependent oxidoreductase [Deltaproteobacteria bacterium]
MSRKSNKKPSGKPRVCDSKPVTHIDSEKGQKPFLSEDKEVILTKVGYLPPLKAPPIRKRKDVIPEKKYDFEAPPEPIRADDIKENINAEVVVVGAGIAGLSAALSAAEAGAKTILLEKTATVQARGHDNAFIGSRLQEKLGIEIDKDEVILNLMKYGSNKPDQRLIRMWAEGSGETADWLMDMTDAAGLKVIIKQHPPPPVFDNATEYYPQYQVTHHYRSERPVAKCLLDNALKKGVAAFFEIRAKQLLRKKRDRVTGVIAQNAAGEYLQFNATKAVILCTGDYGNNAEMMAKYCPQSSYLAPMMTTSTGDGHMMAMWIGAIMEPGPHTPMIHGPAGPLLSSAFLQVNIMGERFQNEDVPIQSNVNAVERQPGKMTWQVFDSKYTEELPYHGIGLGKIIIATENIRQKVTKAAIMADSIEELAAKMNLPVKTFRATVKRYNKLARLGKDLDFGKRPDRLSPIDKPPYYAGKSGYSLLTVLGGLNINQMLQPLDKDWKVIPGIYLAGNTMGNRFSGDYPTMCPGLSHGMAIHFGRTAGLNAVSQK